MREYKLTAGPPMTVKAPETSCLFCNHCTDVFYDLGGIYATWCDLYLDDKVGASGKCNQFEEEVDDGGIH